MRRTAAALIVSAWFGALGGVAAQASTTAPPLRVSQNHLVDAGGQEVHLTGVNRSGTEYACVQGWGIFDGPSDDASVAAISAWGANAVRIGLNEDCWLGINAVDAKYSGAAYRQAVMTYVQLLHQHGLYAIVALMWAAPGANRATWQEAMADADHAPAFWSSVAAAFRDDGATLLDLYGEPSWISWSCWADGCSYADKYGTWQTAGMRQMLSTVRQAGAHNIVLLSGDSYANDLSEWLAYAPSDPDGQVAASFHLYGDNTCHEEACWDSSVREVAKRVPVVTSELGERADGTSCDHTFVHTYIGYAHTNGLSFLAWAWDAWHRCSTLIVDYTGTPTPFGAAYRTDLADQQSFGVLPYVDSRPSRPAFEIEHERVFLFLAGVILVAGVAAILTVGRFMPRRRRARR